MYYTVSVNDEPADIGFLQYVFHAFDVSTLGQPDAAGIATKTSPIMIAGGQDLRPNGGRMIPQKGQQRMRGGASDNFESSEILKSSKCADEISSLSEEGIAECYEPLMIRQGERMTSFVPVSAVDFLFRELNQAVQMSHVPILQQRIHQHRAEGWRQSQSETSVHAVMYPPVHHLEQGKVGLGYGFKQPALFEELFVFRVPNKWKMRVKNESKISRHESGAFLNISRAIHPACAAEEGVLKLGSWGCAPTSPRYSVLR
jgi:hypothetical protein